MFRAPAPGCGSFDVVERSEEQGRRHCALVVLGTLAAAGRIGEVDA